jgi:DNA repair protein RecN (Recombination protein N)
MLSSITIRNFVLIEDAVIELAPGLNVLTGETGAGKTLLTRALGLLAGERAEEGLVGSNGDETVIQAVFDLNEPDLAAVPADLQELAAVELGEVIVSRRLSRSGRNRCFVNDTAVTVSALGRLTSALLSFSGQHEYRRLLEPAYQLTVLDEWGKEPTATAAAHYRQAFTAATSAVRRLARAEESRAIRKQEMELLRFQVAELEAAGVTADEEDELRAEQKVLARAEDLLAAVGAASLFIAGDGGEGGGAEGAADTRSLLAQAHSRLAQLEGVDPALDQIAEAVADVEYQLADLARELSAYAGRVEVDPERLQVVDERLRLYHDLARKYGEQPRELPTLLERSRVRLRELEDSEDDLRALAAAQAELVARATELAVALSAERRRIAPELETSIRSELAGLGMDDAEMQVEIETDPSWGALHESGADRVDFLLSANAGQPLRALSRTASGGELSRILLALKCALAGAGGSETLVFDEVDAGIGGRTAVAVGRKLRQLADGAQLLVVTHLPAVAALADRHYLIAKTSAEGASVTRLVPLVGDAVIEELCRMLGGSPSDPEAMAHARRLTLGVAPHA